MKSNLELSSQTHVCFKLDYLKNKANKICLLINPYFVRAGHTDFGMGEGRPREGEGLMGGRRRG